MDFNEINAQTDVTEYALEIFADKEDAGVDVIPKVDLIADYARKRAEQLRWHADRYEQIMNRLLQNQDQQEG